MKLLYITSLSGKRINGFMRSAIIAARNLGIDFTMACNMDQADKQLYAMDCEHYGIKTVHIDFDRNPLAWKNYMVAQKQLTDLMKKERYDVVHCNTPIGGVLGRICAKKANVPYVIYQAHGFHFWKGAPAKNWLLYYPVECFLAHYTDMLITINNEDYERAKKFHLKTNGKVVKVPGVGVDTAKFGAVNIDVKKKREELGVSVNAEVYITVCELITRKNIDTLIKAFKKAKIDNAYLLICGEGQEKENLQALIDREGLQNSVKLLGFRSDISELLHCADVFVFPTKQEGLPGALMEAMATGIPCVASSIRGNTDLLGDNYEFLFDPMNVEDLARKMKEILQNKDVLGEYSRSRIASFDIQKAIDSYKNLYEKISGGYELSILINRQKLRKRWGIPLESLIFVSVGELNKNKNQAVGIQAFATANIPNSYYLICGEGEKKLYLTDLSRKLGKSEEVMFLGFQTNIPEILSACDCFVFTSLREGLPGALMEAMATGLPCIASKIRGCTDLLGDRGLLFEARDTQLLSDYMQKMSDRKIREAEGIKNQIRVQKYNIQEAVLSYEQLYSSIA